MKKAIWLMLALTVTMAGCRNEKRIDGFVRQASTVAKPAGEKANTVAKPAQETAGTVNLLRQWVKDGVPHKLITRKGYTTSYNRETRTPNWVAWTLTKEHTYGRLLRENERFEEDPAVPTPRATFQDYYSSRYDRGHMCPAGDNKWDQEAMTQSFLMTNICPQNHGLNKEDWNDLEMQCRTWARRFGEVTVVCGPLYDEGAAVKTIGRNKVRVPDAFFKVVYCPRPQPRTLAFVFRNHGQRQPWREQLCTVDDVEQLSGINFFFQLADDVEDTIEAVSDLSAW